MDNYKQLEKNQLGGNYNVRRLQYQQSRHRDRANCIIIATNEAERRKWHRLNRDKAIIFPLPNFHFECISLSAEQTNCKPNSNTRLHYYEIPDCESRRVCPAIAHAATSSLVFNLQLVRFQVRVRVQSLRKSLRCRWLCSSSSLSLSLFLSLPLQFILNHLLFTLLWPRHANCLGK